MQLSRLTDEQYIQRIRRGERWRPYLGVLSILLGLAMAALLFALHQSIRGYSETMAHRMIGDLAPGAEVELKTVMQNARWTGMVLGGLLGFLAVQSGLAIGCGVFALLRVDRRTRLLLQLWDRQQGQA